MRMSFSNLLLISALGLTACSMKSVRSEAKENKPEAPKETAVATSQAKPAPAPSKKSEPAKEVAHASAPVAAAPAPTTAAHVETTKGVEPEKALGWLKNGNTRYIKSSLRKDGQSKKDIERLSKGQAPHSIILSCSDSRVPPEIVFDQKLGEIFVIRNAGEIPDQASVASIEYAVEHLGSRLIVVMGHTSCGAVKAALGTLDGADAGSPALNALVQDIHPRLASFKGKPQSPGVEDESWANARGISKELLSRSAILRSKVASGEVVIKTALYHLDDGKVDFDQ